MQTRKLFLVIFFLFISALLQGSEADSLEQLLPELQGKERVDVLTRLTVLNVRSDHQKSFAYGNEALELARKLNYDKGVADALLHMSSAYYLMSNYHQAIDYLQQNLEIREKLKDTVMITDALTKLGVNYRMLGNFEESLSVSFHVLKIREIIADTIGIAGIYNNIGGIYRSLGNQDKALEYYTLAHEIYTDLNFITGLAQTSNNMGIMYRLQGDYEKALEYYMQSLELDLELGHEREVAQSYNNIGILHLLLENYDKAIASFYQSLEISKRIKNLETQLPSFLYLAESYKQTGQLNLSRKYLEQALELARLTGNIGRQNEVYTRLAGLHTELGNHRKANEFYNRVIQIRDSLHQAQIRAIVAEIEAKYEFEKKAREIEALRQENRIQELKLNENRILTYGFALIALAILIIAVLLIQKNRLQTKQKNAELEQKLFRTQMNPHFIFNALNAIQSFIYKNEPAEAGKYLSNFARLIRLVLNNSREDFITLDNEIRTLEYYLQLQQLRFNNKFDFKINIDPSINKELIMVPPMLAQPFIENSIEHGIQHMSSKGDIEVTFAMQNGWISFKVVDNGIGITRSKLKNAQQYNRHESFALNITEERLKLLNQSRQQKIELRIEELSHNEDDGKGTAITFNIPFRTIKDRVSD